MSYSKMLYSNNLLKLILRVLVNVLELSLATGLFFSGFNRSLKIKTKKNSS